MGIVITLGVLLIILNLACAFSIIFIERKDPTTTWAWLLIFILLPGLGFIIYIFNRTEF